MSKRISITPGAVPLQPYIPRKRSKTGGDSPTTESVAYADPETALDNNFRRPPPQQPAPVINTCSICLENINETPYRNVVALLPCGHVYHEDCHAGLRASVLERAADDDDDDNNNNAMDIPEARVIKCPSCNQITQNFGRLFFNLSATPVVPRPAPRRAATLELLVHHDLWSTDAATVECALKRIKNSFLDDTQAFILLGGHVVVLRAMERLATVPSVQFHSMRIILVLADRNHGVVLNAVQAYQTLLTAMRTHARRTEIQAIAGSLLHKLCQADYSAEHVRQMGHGGISLALQALKRLDPRLLINLVQFLTLVTLSENAATEHFCQHDGISILIEALHKTLDQPTIQACGCRLLGELVFHSATAKREILLYGGLTALSAALEKYSAVVFCTAPNLAPAQADQQKAAALQIERFAQRAMCRMMGMETPGARYNGHANNSTNDTTNHTGTHNGNRRPAVPINRTNTWNA